MPKTTKVKFSRYFEGEDKLNQNTPSVCRLSKGCNSNILGTVWFVKLKLIGLFVKDVELTKRKYLHPNATASTHTTATTTTAIKTENIKAINLIYIETVWNLIDTHYAHAGCQADASEMLQK